MWKFLCKTTTAGLKDLPRKVAMVLAKGTLDFANEVSFASAKARDGVRERNFGFPRRGHFVMKVILGNAHLESTDLPLVLNSHMAPFRFRFAALKGGWEM